MIQTMRWYGPDDAVSLADIRQAGCQGVVTALHHIPIGEVWSIDEIIQRKKQIEKHALQWTVVESLPVHEDIKKRDGPYQSYIENYKTSLMNLAQCGIEVVVYNFMPLLDWMRTDLVFAMPTGALSLRFEKKAFIAFDLFLLQRPNAHLAYTIEEIQTSKAYFEHLDVHGREKLLDSCLQALPGSKEKFKVEKILDLLASYQHLDSDLLRAHLVSFLTEITPIADLCGIKLAIHPDDPPFSILGLPRIMSTQNDAAYLANAVPSKSNGFCFCSGSFGANPNNNLPEMIRMLSDRIHFLHLRSIKRDDEGNFYEANHLEGDADLYTLVREMITIMQQQRREIPMRPDHGHQMLDDLHKKTYPGYSAIGRLKALAEIRGLEMGILGTLFPKN